MTRAPFRSATAWMVARSAVGDLRGLVDHQHIAAVHWQVPASLVGALQLAQENSDRVRLGQAFGGQHPGGVRRQGEAITRSPVRCWCTFAKAARV